MSLGGLPSSTDLTSTTILMKLACDRILTEAREPLAGPYRQWRRVHAEAVKSAERSAQHKANLRVLDSLVRNGITPRDREEARPYCMEQLPQVLIAAGATPDRRFRTPESAWKTFVSALETGDRPTVLLCLRDPALEQHRAVFDTLSTGGMPVGLFSGHGYAERTVQLADNDVLFFYTDGLVEVENEAGEMPAAQIRRADGTTHTVFFLQEPNGDWKTPHCSPGSVDQTNRFTNASAFPATSRQPLSTVSV